MYAFKFHLLFIGIISFFALNNNAESAFEECNVSGIVQDEFGPIEFVKVCNSRTNECVETDADGKFCITAKENDELKITYYTGITQTIKVAKMLDLGVINLESHVALEDVVITGYSDKLKDEVRGLEVASVSTVDAASKVKIRGISSTVSSTATASEAAGQLTGGEVHDLSKWELWKDLETTDLANWNQHWKVNPQERVAVVVKLEDQSPAYNQTIKLINEKNEILWETKTDNLGRAELWNNAFLENNKSTQLKLVNENDEVLVEEAIPFSQGLNIIELNGKCEKPNPVLDIAFVVDATGSMGDEINYLKAEFLNVIQRAKDTLQNADLQTAALFYRDRGDAYVTKYDAFTHNIERTSKFIKDQYADGGGDYPEAVITALEVTLDSLKWRDNSTTKIAFLVLDAPFHHNPENLAKFQNLTKQFAKSGIKIIPLSGSGIKKDTEYLMRSLALLTNGTYTFLSDHSGIGNPHIEPTTDSYKVEKINDLLLRLITQFSYFPDCEVSLTQVNTPSHFPLENLQNVEKWEVNLAPNPTKGPIQIKSNKKLKEVLVLDMTGRLLYRKELGDKKENIDVTALSTGIYYLKILNQKEEEKAIKVIKK